MVKQCPKCKIRAKLSGLRKTFVKCGFFRRRSDKKWIQRFKCFHCACVFSKASFDVCYRQHKRQINQSVFNLLASGNSQRRIAYLLNLNRKTVKRKFIFLGGQSLLHLRKFNRGFSRAQLVEFDDLETFEHTKMKPLSVTLAVEGKTRRVLGFSVAQMPAKGHLAKKSFLKYGPRKDERVNGRKNLFCSIKGLIEEKALIKSDQNPHYPEDVKKYFKDCTV